MFRHARLKSNTDNKRLIAEHFLSPIISIICRAAKSRKSGYFVGSFPFPAGITGKSNFNASVRWFLDLEPWTDPEPWTLNPGSYTITTIG
jgi:hypothetical protein